MDVLAKRVARATQAMPAYRTPPMAAEDAFARMKSVTKIRPRTAEEVDKKSPEYVFGEAFTNMVRHIVTGYLDKAVVPIIRHTIESELDRLLASNRL